MVQTIVQEILDTLPAIMQEEIELDKKYGIDRSEPVTFGDENAMKRAFEKNKHEISLHEKLLNHKVEALRKVEALMYYGRAKDSESYAEKLQSLRNQKDDSLSIVRTILEKIPACGKYFQTGLVKLQREGVSIDNV
jgi:hypothetical protein